MTNSIKFTSEGTVALTAKINKETPTTTIIEFQVEDTGIGIEEETRKKLFTPFSQADSSTARRYGGTGLGLTISKSLVELMHGEIFLESKLGQGTKAWFWIPFKKADGMSHGSPLVDLGSIPSRLQSELSISVGSDERNTPPQTPTTFGPSGNAGTPGSLTPVTPGRTRGTTTSTQIPDHIMALPESERKEIHILVVEDNQINQQIALKTIKKLNFSVSAVWNGKEALDYLLEEPSPTHPTPDIILMDVQMPLMDGYRATHTIRTREPFKQAPFIPIVAMTASAIQGDKEKCQRAGMDDYLAKPVKGKVLESMLVKWAIKGKKQRAERSGPVVLPWQRKTPGLTGEFFANERDVPGKRSGLSHSYSFGESDISEEVPPSPTIGTGPPITHTDVVEARKQSYVSTAALASTAVTEGESTMRRAEAEERAIALRDDKLLSAADNPRLQRRITDEAQHHAEPLKGSLALTEANVERLDGEQSKATSSFHLQVEGKDETLASNSSLIVQGRPSQESERPSQPDLDPQAPLWTRPALGEMSKRNSDRTERSGQSMDSDRTATPGNLR